MEFIEIIGFFCALIIGATLGLIGGGGSILTVPVLVYLMGEDVVLSTAYSLFIVGISSAIGAKRFANKKLLDVKIASIFGIPSILTVFATRAWLVPAIPETIFKLGDFHLLKDNFLLALFALLMILASYSMIKGRKFKNQAVKSLNYPLIITEGVIVGVLTGLVGAGGGFLIIPALVVVAGMEMKKAIGTSLAIIAAKSLAGFVGDLGNLEIDWKFLLIFTALAVGGIFIGSSLSYKIKGDKLKPVFGWFVLIMGVLILANELLLM